MISLLEEKVYTRTRAYTFLKILLGFPKNNRLCEEFVLVFFTKTDESLFQIKKNEEEVKKIFASIELKELIKAYVWLVTTKGKNSIETKSCSGKIIALVREKMA